MYLCLNECRFWGLNTNTDQLRLPSLFSRTCMYVKELSKLYLLDRQWQGTWWQGTWWHYRVKSMTVKFKGNHTSKTTTTFHFSHTIRITMYNRNYKFTQTIGGLLGPAKVWTTITECERVPPCAGPIFLPNGDRALFETPGNSHTSTIPMRNFFNAIYAVQSKTYWMNVCHTLTYQ